VSDPRSKSPPLDPRFKIAGVGVILGGLYVLLQHTSAAPFPHAADDFIAGLAFGLALAMILAWWSRRS
jgi:hypothetical protein